MAEYRKSLRGKLESLTPGEEKMTTNLGSFDECTLMISARSPFARRVRLAFLENRVSFHEHLEDVFKPTSDLIQINPLRRVPSLRLKNGTEIVDSHLILQAFYLRHPESPWNPARSSDPDRSFAWSGLAVGLCERTVERFLEVQRPPERQDPEIIQEFEEMAKGFLARLEAILDPSRPSLVSSGLNQTDIDLATALNYLSLRHSSAWKNHYPKTLRYLETWERRPSFNETLPPA
jgi:glutathione S-transferase